MTFERTVFSPRMVEWPSNFSNTSQSAKNLFDMSPNKNFTYERKMIMNRTISVDLYTVV